MRVNREHHGVALPQVTAEPLDDIGVEIGCVHLHGRWQIDDRGPVDGRLPYVHHGLAHLEGELGFRAGEGLG
jgi:hypothetical protein